VAAARAVPVSTPMKEGRMELDTHADTCVLGSNFTLLQYTGRQCDVLPYMATYEPVVDIPIVSGATCVQDPETGETLILIVHEGLWYGEKMENSLINPNQLRHYGLIVQDNPYADEGSIYIQAPESEMTLPLSTLGTILYLHSRTPTNQELVDCRHIVLTSENEWNPTDIVLSAVEVQVGVKEERQRGYNHDMRMLSTISSVYHPEYSYNRLRHVFAFTMEQIQDLPPRYTFTSKKRHSSVTAADLSEKWQLGLRQAEATIDNTTQKYVRSALLPLSRRYRTDRHFLRKHLYADFAADLYVGRYTSIRGFKYALIMTHKCGFAAAYPQETKSSAEAADSLRLFTQQWGIPQKLTTDGAKEFTERKTAFQKKVREYDISMHVSSPYTPSENPAEGVIREVRKKWLRIFVAKRVPARLWCYGIQWTCDIMQRTVSSSMYANGRTPIELLTGETPDISEFLDFGFYDWVWYKENAGLGETVLGRWLGVSHTIGNAMA
jgi:hypothetical protein